MMGPMGRGIGDRERAAQEEIAAGVGWELREESGGCTVVGGAGPAKRELRRILGGGSASGGDLWVRDSVERVRELLTSAGFGVR